MVLKASSGGVRNGVSEAMAFEGCERQSVEVSRGLAGSTEAGKVVGR